MAAVASVKVPKDPVGMWFARNKSLGKSLAAFQLRRGFVRSKNSQTARFEKIGDSERQRQLRTDDRQIDLFLLSEVSELSDLLRTNRH